MRVLVISHNAFNKDTNIGRSLINQFEMFSKEELAQIYFNKGIPCFQNCEEYFHISDSDVFCSIFKRNFAGYLVDLDEKVFCDSINKKNNSIKSKIMKKGRRPIIYLLRNAIWSLGRWKSKQLNEWLDKINPDVIYFASGDYSFSYKVTMYIAKKRDIPVIVGCYDDFYIGKRKTINPLYHIYYNGLIKNAKKLFTISAFFMGISEMMTEDYKQLFKTKGYTMYIPTEIDNSKVCDIRKNRVFYAGNLSYGRAEQLVLLGNAIKSLNRSDITHIDVYSGETRESMTRLMREENGIVFHGKVSSDQVKELMLTSKYVIHTESFDMDNRMRVRYSISTKIADCLSCGACIIAFGPKDVASIKYFDNANAAWIISDKCNLTNNLIELFDNAHSDIVANAINLSNINHRNIKKSEEFKQIIISSVKRTIITDY